MKQFTSVCCISTQAVSEPEASDVFCFHRGDDDVKRKVVPVLAMKAWKSRGRAPLILNLGARWRKVVAITPREINSVPVEYESG